jgi:hypothetical protein
LALSSLPNLAMRNVSGSLNLESNEDNSMRIFQRHKCKYYTN